MKVEATVSFAGKVCMAEGEIRDVPESIAAPLLKCGYLKSLEAEAGPPETTAKPKRSRGKAKTEG